MTATCPTARDRRRGYFLMDTIIGLVLAGVLGTILVVAISRGGTAERRLADNAAATRIAQRAMFALHDGKSVPTDFAGATVWVKPAEGGAKVEGRSWVEVTVQYRGRQASLIGLVPQGGAP
jgi:type II secretory pathway pseudopilin PulG